MRTNLIKNAPIATVIGNYINKQSGRVVDSRRDIQRRFFGLDWTDQKTILSAFLEAGKTDRDWAYKQLLDLWDACFQEKIQELWDTYHEEKCGWVIIRHFPSDYLKEHIDEFNEGRDYYFICRRLASDADFVIRKDKLDKKDYIMAMYHAGKHISDEEATDLLFEIVRDITFVSEPAFELSRKYMSERDELIGASDFTNVSIALYYLKLMGNKEVVDAFRKWDAKIEKTVCLCEDFKTLDYKTGPLYEYKFHLAKIVRKPLYLALPAKYKTMTDDEYCHHHA